MVSTPATCAEQGSAMDRTAIGGGFIPDEGEIVFHKGVRRVDGWALLHLRFVLVVVGRGESGR